MASGISILIGIVVVIVVIGAAVYLLGKAPSTSYTTTVYGTSTVPVQSQRTSQTPVVLTDPLTVPAGTSAYVMTYSNVMVHSTGANATGWASAQGSGSVNLMAINSSGEGQVMGWANVTTNSSIDMVQYTITSAKITVNGTTYNVTLPANSTVTAQTSGNAKVNSTTSVVINTSPVVTAYTNSSASAKSYTWTSTNAKALVYANSTFAANARANVGTTVSINAGLISELNSVLGLNLSVRGII